MVHFFNLINQQFTAEKLFRTIDQSLPQMSQGDELVVALGVTDYPALRGLADAFATYAQKNNRLDSCDGRAVVLQAPSIRMQFRLIVSGRGEQQRFLMPYLENLKNVSK